MKIISRIIVSASLLFSPSLFAMHSLTGEARTDGKASVVSSEGKAITNLEQLSGTERKLYETFVEMILIKDTMQNPTKPIPSRFIKKTYSEIKRRYGIVLYPRMQKLIGKITSKERHDGLWNLANRNAETERRASSFIFDDFDAYTNYWNSSGGGDTDSDDEVS